MESLKLAIYLALIALSLYQCSAEDGAAVQFTSDTFKESKGSNPLFVKFYAPWCGHCKRMAPTWEELAAKFNVDGQKIVIGKVDCTVETALCSENGVTGYPTLKFYNAEGEDEKYKGGRDLDTLEKFVREKIGGDSGPAAAGGSSTAVAENGLYTLKEEDFDAHIATGMHLIKFYAPWCGHCKRLAPIWDELAAKYGKDAAVKIAKVDCTKQQAICSKMDDVRGYPTLLFFKDGKMAEKYPGGRDMNSFDAFISKKSGKDAPAAPKQEEPAAAEPAAEGMYVLNSDNIKQVIDSEKTTFVKFYAPWCGHCKNMVGEWVKLAKKYANAKGVQIADVDCTKTKECKENYGVQGFPTLKVFRAGQELAQHRSGRDVESMSKFLEEHVLDGQLEGAAADQAEPAEPKSPAKGEAEPPTDEENGLVTLTDLTFDSVAKTTKTTFVMFHAPWCGHCKRLAPDWALLAKSFMDNDSVVIAKVDCTENRNICVRYGVKGYPTLKLFREGNDLGEHNGGRSLEDMQQFVKDNFVDENEMEKKRDEL